ncbi:MAG: hypothetical protein Q4F67_05150 [Propionibacteriaceae bacterium]|nr:hypothetical protein [Propionibacteriaceae bacterium]
MSAAAPQPTGGPAATGPSAGRAGTGVATAPGPTKAVVKTQAPAGPPVARPEDLKTPTPALLRVWLMVTVLAVIAFTVVSSVTLMVGHNTLARAADSFDQLARVESVRTDLLNADATAAHGYLGTGDTDYREPLARTRVALVEAAEAVPADRPALADLNRDLDLYAAHLEEARVGRDTPAGQAALVAAGAHLRQSLLPPLESLVEINTHRVAGQTAPVPSWPLVVTGILALAALAVTGVLTAIRFRRLLNLGLLAAFIAVAVAFGVAISTTSQTNHFVDLTSRNDLVPFGETAAARGHAYDARAQEAIALIERNDRPDGDQPWQAAADRTTAALQRVTVSGDGLRAPWDHYVRAHSDVRAAAGAGRWDEARDLAVGSGPTTAGGRFAAFDRVATESMSRSVRHGRSWLDSQAGPLQGAALGTGIGGLIALACALLGVRLRLREYA